MAGRLAFRCAADCTLRFRCLVFVAAALAHLLLLTKACKCRHSVLGLPSEQTSFFRLFNSEGDGMRCFVCVCVCVCLFFLSFLPWLSSFVFS